LPTRERNTGMFLVGILAAFGMNYLWEIFKLPGYDVRVLQLPQGSHPTYLGADDVLLLAIGFIFLIGGRKNRELIAFGLGWIVGIIVTKVFEYANTNTTGLITPGSFAL
jgi:hypothetical protein